MHSLHRTSAYGQSTSAARRFLELERLGTEEHPKPTLRWAFSYTAEARTLLQPHRQSVVARSAGIPKILRCLNLGQGRFLPFAAPENAAGSAVYDPFGQFVPREGLIYPPLLRQNTATEESPDEAADVGRI